MLRVVRPQGRGSVAAAGRNSGRPSRSSGITRSSASSRRRRRAGWLGRRLALVRGGRQDGRVGVRAGSCRPRCHRLLTRRPGQSAGLVANGDRERVARPEPLAAPEAAPDGPGEAILENGADAGAVPNGADDPPLGPEPEAERGSELRESEWPGRSGRRSARGGPLMASSAPTCSICFAPIEPGATTCADPECIALHAKMAPPAVEVQPAPARSGALRRVGGCGPDAVIRVPR